MTHEQLVENVAMSIFAMEGAVHTDGERMFQPVEWEDLDDEDYQCVRDGYREKARAAIAAVYEAMREPTREMNNAGSYAHVNEGKLSDEIWEAMLEASPLKGE